MHGRDFRSPLRFRGRGETCDRTVTRLARLTDRPRRDRPGSGYATAMTTALRDHPDHLDRGPDHGPPTVVVDLATAAELLGTSKETVRSRVRRGTLRAVKRASHWLVTLPAPTVVPDHSTTVTTAVTTEATSGHDRRAPLVTGALPAVRDRPLDYLPTRAAPPAAVATPVDLRHLEELVRTLRAENSRLWGEVERLTSIVAAFTADRPRRPWWVRVVQALGG